jgi:non-ribosomal peptide synthetase component F
MISTIEAVQHFAARAALTVRSATECVTYHALGSARAKLARELNAKSGSPRSPPTTARVAVVDLAAQLARTVLVPLPPFFSREQIAHVLTDSGADALLADPRLPALRDFDVGTLEPLGALGGDVAWCRLRASPVAPMPTGTAKISYTSGTTGKPKGVCLRQESMDAVADSLRRAVADLRITRHLCVLPRAATARKHRRRLCAAHERRRDRDAGRARNRSPRRVPLRCRFAAALRRDVSAGEHHSRPATAGRPRRRPRARRTAAGEP